MNAVILSAGQGRRLLPLTEGRPKCLLPLHGRTVIEWQIDTLLAAGIDCITVVVGFQAATVERLLSARYDGRVRTLFNPFYQVADNLGSCWIARSAMHDNFVLLNGDTLFESRMLTQLLDSTHAITVATDHKDRYDADDMKVRLCNGWLHRIGKDLPHDSVDGESIGMLLFREHGADLFREAVDARLRNADATQSWYLSVIDWLAQHQPVATASVAGLEWAEIDYPADYEFAKALTAGWLKRLEVAEEGEPRIA